MKRDLTSEEIRSIESAFLNELERHLDFDSEIVPYTRGSIDAAGREVVESHIEDCAQCREEIADLQRIVHPPRRPVRRVLAVAAMIVIALTILLLVQRDDSPRDVTPETRTAPVVRSVSGYENPEWKRLVDTAVAQDRLPFPADLEALRPKTDTLRGAASAGEEAMQPQGTAVDTTRPRFRWPSAGGASYEVFVFRGEEQVAQSPRLDVAEWIPDRDLGRGMTYVWQVEVSRGGSTTLLPGPPARAAAFRIVDARQHEELERARMQHPDDHLLLAVLSARAGLVPESIVHLEALASSGDASAKRLLVTARQEASPRRTKPDQ